MKTNFIAKHKWWALAIVLMVALMAVSVSYSTWDILSVKTSIAAKGGAYSEAPAWSNYTKLVYDRYLSNGSLGVNGIIDVGDIVEYGRFYQDTEAVNTGKTDPQRWVVVDYNSSTKVATLLTEKVVVYGNFWGGSGQYYQNYYQSTVRSWLNSGKGSLKGSGTTWKDNERYADNVRSDNVGSEFSGGATQVNKGFLDVAFTTDEKSILIPKNMTGMSGYAKNVNSGFDTYKTTDSRTNVNDLVWLPSWQEIYGTKENQWFGMTLNDGTPNTKFSYFNDVAVYSGASPTRNWVSPKAISGATGYAINASLSSYFNNGDGSTNGSATATWWWLRSPIPAHYYYALIVSADGSGHYAATCDSNGGVRPAVLVQL